MIGIEDLAEMALCRSALEDVLERLDKIGAGLAAIHVDAAIMHLGNNLDAELEKSEVGVLDEALPRPYALPQTRH